MRKVFSVPSAALIACLLTAVAAGVVAAQSPEPAADPMAPAWVTGSITLAPTCADPTIRVEGGVTEERGYRCEPQTWTLSDPRLSGTAASTWNADVYRLAGATVSVRSGAYDVQNEAGGWRCTFADDLAHGSGLFAASVNAETVTCAGSGSYEGLTAILAIDTTTTPFPVIGIIMAGEAPPIP